MSKLNLLNYSLPELQELVESLNEKSFRAKQLYQWLHQQHIISVSDMHNISKSFQEKIDKIAKIELPTIEQEIVASDGTIRWVLRLSCNNSIETVFIPEKNRGTLCVSSEAGCAANCKFCQTAVGGFNRDLTAGEIIGQLSFAIRRLKELKSDDKVTNVVMMGMGEPLLNFDNVVKAVNIMMDDKAYGLSKYKVTISTIGIIPSLVKLADATEAALTVSLHATTNELRTQIMPINKKYPLEDLLDVCRNYFPKDSKRKITFAYIMLDGVNDSISDATRLVKLVSDIPCKVNLIPFNTFPGAQFTCSHMDQIQKFKNTLVSKGLQATIRKTRGDDVSAACGMLVGEVKKRQKKFRQ